MWSWPACYITQTMDSGRSLNLDTKGQTGWLKLYMTMVARHGLEKWNLPQGRLKNKGVDAKPFKRAWDRVEGIGSLCCIKE